MVLYVFFNLKVFNVIEDGLVKKKVSFKDKKIN